MKRHRRTFPIVVKIGVTAIPRWMYLVENLCYLADGIIGPFVWLFGYQPCLGVRWCQRMMEAGLAEIRRREEAKLQWAGEEQCESQQESESA